MSTRPPLPPFTQESATLRVRLAEDGWNSRDPEKVALAYTADSRWHDDSGNWFRSYGNENWEFDNDGLMRLRLASIRLRQHMKHIKKELCNLKIYAKCHSA
jgi:nuclear transport factor 2 (NTF2) superfamily protein